MIELGKSQELIVVSRKPHGVYLAETPDAGADERILLPAKEVPEGTVQGGSIQVFIYRDSDDRLIATMKQPLIRLGETAVLRVRDVTKIGAFLDWGLQKDLLLPFHEQTARVSKGEEVLCALYTDRSGRLAATMKVYPYLRTDSPYIPVAVDDLYSGMIPERELSRAAKVGDVLSLRVTAVKEDGKLDLSARDKAYLQMDEDAEAVMKLIVDAYGGKLPFDDKADPERIREVTGLSKAAFKRAVGKLYREHRVLIEDGCIRSV